MLQHKQEERALKRYEGDIIKKQHHLRRTMEDVNNSVYKKMRAEEARLSENNHEMEKVKQQHFIQEDKINKTRIEKNLSSQMKVKDKGRKVALEMTEAEFQYCKAAKKLELTRTEVFALTQQFEASLKRIEEKGDALKKSLAELAIAANQLALKKRTQEVEDERYNRDKTIKDIQDDRRRQQSLSEKLKSISGQGVKVEYNKRRMSRDLLVSKDMLSLKSREEGRKMTDINRRLQHNSTHQKQAKQAAEYLELDRQGKEIEEKGQFAEARRKHQIEQLTKDRKQLQSTQMLEWKKRFIEKQNEATRRVHEDNVKHLQVN
ncbi:PREDICTED: coiled-coil domain-containing protein 18-like [Acropora digitifera]|uniref:coiled-coil domain-containing protein 18-like n=1 Tax=Acropora digitifera TaxID=70779 RepID=UPI00077AEE0E|nr:PREDICTED: coiled-coil domain-containing protein 18-like [Acropora digitifera]